LGNLNIPFPAQESVKKKHYGLFWHAVQGVAANPKRDPAGTRGAAGYTLPNHPLQFGV
jgi:hypothetical protein